MENKSMHADHTPEGNPEQLLKLLESQVATARARRAKVETGRTKASTIGLVVIVVGAAVALWMLMLLLEQMRPQPAGGSERGRTTSAHIER